METISRHELVPFTALMNMIKFNYLEKKEVFQTLLGILEDYDPTDEENKKKTTRYIELLLSDQSDLAEYLLSFLPNGMSVDHIGVTEVKEESKLNLKKKKTMKLCKVSRPSSTSNLNQPEPSKSTSVTPLQEASLMIQKQVNSCNKIPILPAKLKNSPQLTFSVATQQSTYVMSDEPITQNSMQLQHRATDPSTARNTFQPLGLTNNVKSDFNLSNDNFYQVWGNNLNMQNNNVSNKDNIPSSSVQVLSSNLPIVYVNNSSQTPVCPVVPSVNLQKVQGDKEIPVHVNSVYMPRQQCEWLPVSPETVTEQTVVPLQFSTNGNFLENAGTSLPGDITTALDEDESIQNICNTADDLVFDLQSYNSIPENVQYIQHEPLLPNVRFPLHSTPKTNYTPNNTGISIPRKSIGHDLLSMIQQPIIEQQYPSAVKDVGNSNLYSNTRTLSSFPYTHEFVLPNGKTQNLYINRTGLQMEQALHTTQNNIVIKSINKNQPSSVQVRNNLTNFTGLPVQNMTNLPSQVCSQTTIYNPNNVQLVSTPSQPQIIRNYPPYTHIQSQNIVSTQSHPPNIRNYTPSQSQNIVSTQSQPQHIRNYTPLQSQNAYQQNRSMGNLIDTPHDMFTPIQYNQELNLVDPILSNHSLDNTGNLLRAKPKKLTMTANSSVRKKLRLTPNNSNLPI